jgi:hypothetical protein
MNKILVNGRLLLDTAYYRGFRAYAAARLFGAAQIPRVPTCEAAICLRLHHPNSYGQIGTPLKAPGAPWPHIRWPHIQ